MHLFFIVFMKFTVLLCMHCCMCDVQMYVSVCGVIYVWRQRAAFRCLPLPLHLVWRQGLSPSRQQGCLAQSFGDSPCPPCVFLRSCASSFHVGSREPVLRSEASPLCTELSPCPWIVVFFLGAHPSNLMQQHLHQN